MYFKHPILSILLCFIAYCAHTQYVPGHSAVEYTKLTEPGLTIKNLAAGPLHSSRMRIYNDQDIRFEVGVSSSANLGLGENRPYLQAFDDASIDFWTGGLRRMILDNQGRLGINSQGNHTQKLYVEGDPEIGDTVAYVKLVGSSGDAPMAFVADAIPNGPASTVGIAGVFRGGMIGGLGFSEAGSGLEGRSENSIGVFAFSKNGVGLKAVSNDSTAIVAKAHSKHAILASTNAANEATIKATAQHKDGLAIDARSDSNSEPTVKIKNEKGKALVARGHNGPVISSHSFIGPGLVATSQGPGEGIRGSSYLGHGVRGEATYNLVSKNFDFYAAGTSLDWGSHSSQRWKNNVQNIEDPLGKMSMIRGVRFDWDEEHGGERHDIGFIAEEIGAVLPEIVSYEENGTDAIAMDYTRVVALVVEAFNTLRTQYDQHLGTLDDQIIDLQNQINALSE